MYLRDEVAKCKNVNVIFFRKHKKVLCSNEAKRSGEHLALTLVLPLGTIVQLGLLVTRLHTQPEMCHTFSYIVI